MNKTFFYVFITYLLVGCIPYPLTHKQPEKITVENEKYINQSFDKAWSNVASQLFNDAFILNTIDKNTGIITATFKSDRANNYVDCGIVKRKYRDTEKVTHEYIYNYADSTKYIYNEGSHTYDATVTTDLLAEVTAKVVAKGEGSTIVIDVDYTLNRELNAKDPITKQTLPSQKEQLKFTSKTPYKTDKFSCITNGSIESTLLDNIN